ncbi:MAG: carboxypeptidase M32 [Victivallales bacterium]|nr:carboxypeptidase M32 [Victivallales bacterium]
MKKIDELKQIVGELQDLQAVLAVLDWDQQTFMPRGGAEERAAQTATVSRMEHEKFTAPALGELLQELQQEMNNRDPESDDYCLVKVMSREYNRKTRVPAELVAEFARATTIAQHEWEQAYHAADFARLRPHLEKIFALRRDYAACFAPYDHIYDPLLDEFEPGLKTADVMAIFNKVRPRQTALIHELGARPQLDDRCLHQSFDPQVQWDFGVKVATQMGYDWNRGRLDRALHPFTTTFGLGDVRITTKILPDHLTSGLFSTMHESGHALYEQGVARHLARTPLGTGASLAIHESQSRLWENMVGRSREFWQWAYPQLRQCFPTQLGTVPPETFYAAVNRVQPSCIRTEADEATYNMHIMLRLELEIAVLEQKITVADLPEIWRNKMEEYLGVVPTNDREGVLQDVHWSCGIIGYFPTYALGNMIAAQIWEKARTAIPDLRRQIGRGEFMPLREWLRDHLYRHGSKFEPQELVRRITGTTIDPDPYLNYLYDKYREIYY